MSNVLVKEYRGDVVENVHYGSIAIVASTGETIAYIGDIEKQTYMRSASKPIQVLPTLLAGLHEKFHLNSEEIAIFNSSHWGSNHHMFVLNDIIEKTELNPEDMIMNPCGSFSATPFSDRLSMGSKLNPVPGKSKLQHCCSGKHLSLMLLQRELTGNVKGYQDPDSPVQKQIISFISMLSQTPTYKIATGIDGCGVPVFALPMRNIAHAYAKLADPFNLSEDITNMITYDFECINSHPEKINDYYTPSYYVNKNPDLLMKDGSRGVICMSIRSRKLGIVIKLEDGWSDEFQGIIIARVLEQLKYEDTELIEKLKTCYKTDLYNDCLDKIGYAEADFELNIDPFYFDDLYGITHENDDDENDNENDDIDENDETNENDRKDKTPEELAAQKAYRDRNSILGKNVVYPSSEDSSTYIKNPIAESAWAEPARPVKSAKILSTIAESQDALDVDVDNE